MKGSGQVDKDQREATRLVAGGDRSRGAVKCLDDPNPGPLGSQISTGATLEAPQMRTTNGGWGLFSITASIRSLASLGQALRWINQPVIDWLAGVVHTRVL